jgi:type I restriction enzyme S subunit
MKWPVVLLGDLFDISSSKRVLQRDWKTEGVPFYRAREIVKLAKNGYVENDLYITEEHYIALQKENGTPKKDDLMISAVGTLGACYLVGTNDRFYYKDASVLRFSPKTQLCSKYFVHAFQTSLILDQVNAGGGATVGTYTIERAKKTKIALPPLAEQQRIAALLDTADRILKQRESAIAKLDQLAQSVFVEMLKDAKNCMTIKKLGEICDVRDGTHDSPKYVNEGVPLITSKNLTNGFIDLSNVNLISNSDLFEINKRSKVDYDDILMPMIGTIGNPVIVKDPNPKFAIKNVALIKQIAGSPNSIYLKAVLESASFKSYIEKISRGGTQKFLGLGDIRKFEFAVMDKKNEDKFVNFTKKINSMRDLYLTNALKQKEMLASLQHQSFAVN